jgi:hypothetical protein
VLRLACPTVLSALPDEPAVAPACININRGGADHHMATAVGTKKKTRRACRGGRVAWDHTLPRPEAAVAGLTRPDRRHVKKREARRGRIGSLRGGGRVCAWPGVNRDSLGWPLAAAVWKVVQDSWASVVVAFTKVAAGGTDKVARPHSSRCRLGWSAVACATGVVGRGHPVAG